MVSFTMPTADITTGLAAYEGVATTVTLAFNAPNGSTGGDGNITNNMLLGPIGNAQGTVTIQYEYTPSDSTPVPEPATAGLGALALGMLAWVTRRRHA
jgi:MYXO-CTERM domain-containing protein